jgi:AraC-like DNA-binding protein
VKILYAAAAIQGLFLAILLFKTRINQPANKILSALILLLSFHLVLVGFDNREFFMMFPHLSRVSWIIGSLYWPLIFIFVQYLTRSHAGSPGKYILFFIPFIVLLIVMMPYYLMSAEEKRNILTDFEKASQADFGWINQVVSLLHIFFQTFSLLYYLRLEKKLREEYSEVESIRILWLRQFLIFILSATILAVISFFCRTWNIPVLSNLYSFHFIGIVAIFYWMSYKALTQPVIFGLSPATAIHHVDIPAKEHELTEKYSKSGVDTAKLPAIFQSLETVISTEKLYRKKDLTLSELADRISLPRHQVSQAINSQFEGNFFDLINGYRVEDFKAMAADPAKKNLTLLGIAQEAGFNSKASFYAIFKKKTGLTPSEYLEMQSKSVK